MQKEATMIKWWRSLIIGLVGVSIGAVAYAQESASYELAHFVFSDGQETTISSTSYTASYPILGQMLIGETSSASYASRGIGFVYVIAREQEQEQIYKIKSIGANAEVGGEIILPEVWQSDNDPYFYWQVDFQPTNIVSGYSIALDAEPDRLIDTTVNSFLFPSDAFADGEHIFYVKAVVVGDIWGPSSTFGIWVDATQPTVDNVSPTSGSILSERKPLISCSATDSISGIDWSSLTVKLNNEYVAASYEESQEVIEYEPSTSLADGYHNVLVKISDNAGNERVQGWGFRVDTIGPVGSIVVNAGDDYTESSVVRLSLVAIDSTSDVATMQLSNYKDFYGAQWQEYEELIDEWTVLDSEVVGTKTIYVRFQDDAGNISDTYEDSIELRASALDTKITYGPSLVTDAQDAEFYFESTLSDTMFQYRLDGREWSAWQKINHVEFGDLGLGNHYFQIKAGKDFSGDGEISSEEEDLSPASWVWTIIRSAPTRKGDHEILYWKKE